MTGKFTVAKWGQAQPLAEAPCGGCGQPMLYNLAIGCVVHAERAVDPCDEPWPLELCLFPAPAGLPDAGYVTDDPPEALTGAARWEAFAVADRIAAGGRCRDDVGVGRLGGGE